MVDHGLQVNSDFFHKTAIRIEHDQNAGKGTKGRQVSLERIPQVSLAPKGCQKSNVHGSGTKLKGKSVPLVMPGNRRAVIFKGENQLFVGFHHQAKESITEKQRTFP